MNREIKFKIYYKSGLTGDIIVKELNIGELYSYHPMWVKIGECQFTGLTDKNGKEIYEGDYLLRELNDDDGVYYKEFVECFFGKGQFRQNRLWEKYKCENWKKKIVTLQFDMFFQHKEFEVIGNAFQNPELINE
jgi:uncharacterized phage protein (TIGR01671 family)